MIITLSLRVCQVLFSVIALALSVSLINGQLPGFGKAPAQTDYAAFCGGWGILIALVGCAALFVEAIQGLVMATLDATAMLVSLVGGIVLAAALTTHGCWNDDLYLMTNVIIRGAGTDRDGDIAFNLTADLVGRCHEAKATTAFLWFSFACFAATGVLGVMGRGGKGGSIV